MLNIFKEEREIKEGNWIKGGDIIYQVVKKDGVLGVEMRYWGFISIDELIKEFHGKLFLLDTD